MHWDTLSPEVKDSALTIMQSLCCRGGTIQSYENGLCRIKLTGGSTDSPAQEVIFYSVMPIKQIERWLHERRHQPKSYPVVYDESRQCYVALEGIVGASISREMRSCESYAHQYAKETLIHWLREIAVANRQQGLASIRMQLPGKGAVINWEWRFFLADPCYGISAEYPVLRHTGKDEFFGVLPSWGIRMPEVNSLAPGVEIACIFDVAICSGDQLEYALEVVHRHPCDERKKALLRGLKKHANLQVYEISATWILEQTKRPSILQLLPAE